jgi:hypothetical protein
MEFFFVQTFCPCLVLSLIQRSKDIHLF